MKKIIKIDAEWKELLTPFQYKVCRLKGTEPAFSGKYYRTPLKTIHSPQKAKKA